MTKLQWLYQKIAYRLLRRRNLGSANRGLKYEAMKRLVDDGIAVLKWQDVFAVPPEQSPLFVSMLTEAEKLRREELHPDPAQWKSGYLKRRFKAGEKIPGDCALWQFMHSPELVERLKDFFGGSYRSWAADYWHTVPSDKPLTGSQNWHTDPEDTLMCKVFVYFTDVDADAGATEFMPGSQAGGRPPLRIFEHPGTSGRYYTREEVEQLFAAGAKATRAVGERGTIVFLNTTGLHRGGAGTKDRLMANLTFVSRLCPIRPRWSA